MGQQLSDKICTQIQYVTETRVFKPIEEELNLAISAIDEATKERRKSETSLGETLSQLKNDLENLNAKLESTRAN